MEWRANRKVRDDYYINHSSQNKAVFRHLDSFFPPEKFVFIFLHTYKPDKKYSKRVLMQSNFLPTKHNYNFLIKVHLKHTCFGSTYNLLFP